MRQFELWWVTLPLPVGRRPVLLLSRDPAYAYLNKVLVAEVTTTVRGIPQEVLLGEGEGLSAMSVANLDNLHTVPKRQLGKRIGFLKGTRHREVKRALGHVLGWYELTAV